MKNPFSAGEGIGENCAMDVHIVQVHRGTTNSNDGKTEIGGLCPGKIRQILNNVRHSKSTFGSIILNKFRDAPYIESDYGIWQS